MAYLPKGMVAPSRQIYSFLANGATVNMNVNGAVTPVVFKIQPPAGQVYQLERCILHILDDVAGVKPEDFGGIDGGLTNGCGLHVSTSDDPATDEVLDFFDGLMFKANQDWGRICYDISEFSGGTGANANTAFQGRFTLSKSGQPLFLDGDNSEQLHLEVNDNLTTLVEFTIQVQGRRIV